MTDSHDNLAVAKGILARAKSGDSRAVEWWRRFIHRASDPDGESPMPDNVTLDVADVMISHQQEYVSGLDERN